MYSDKDCSTQVKNNFYISFIQIDIKAYNLEVYN